MRSMRCLPWKIIYFSVVAIEGAHSVFGEEPIQGNSGRSCLRVLTGRHIADLVNGLIVGEWDWKAAFCELVETQLLPLPAIVQVS